MKFGIWNPFKKAPNTAQPPTMASFNKVGDKKNALTGNELFKQSLISGFEQR